MSRVILALSCAVVVSIGICTNAQAQAGIACTATLTGSQVVPPTGSAGNGLCDLSIVPGDGISFYVWYQDLADSLTSVTIHTGRSGDNGPILLRLGDGPLASGQQGGMQWDDSLEVIVGPATLDGIYVTYHTRQFPDGELRGQFDCAESPVQELSWGRIRSLFRHAE